MAVAVIAAAFSILFVGIVFANSGTNQLSSRISTRLDLHSGQVSSSAPLIPLYAKSSKGVFYLIGHYLCPGDWVVNNGTDSGYVKVTYPITVEMTGGSDVGSNYTQYYVTQSDYDNYVIGGTGSFSGADWDTSKWYRTLPTNIGYTSQKGNNGDTVYVGNNTGDFIVSNLNSNGYSQLRAGDWSTIMNAKISHYCFYDSTHSDLTNADYSWSLIGQGWSTSGLVQGSNTVYFAGMDLSGNFTTGSRQFKYDTVAPYCSSVSIKNININGYDVYVYGVGDATSGVQTVKFPTWSKNSQYDLRWDDGTNLGGGTWYYHVDRSKFNGDYYGYFTDIYIYDNAGNYSSYTGCKNIKLDTTPPWVTFSPNSCSWTNQSIPVTITAHDDAGGSGVNYFKYRISSDNGKTWGAWSNNITGITSTTVTLNDTGTYVIQAYVVDNALNDDTGQSGVYYIDFLRPTIQYSPSYSPWINTSVSATITPSDTGGSGVKQYQYRTSTDNGSTWGAWSAVIAGSTATSVTLSTQGTNLIQTQVIDIAGNVSTVTSGQYLIDKALPNVTFDPYSYTTTQPMISVSLFLSDKGGSGLKYSRYRIENNGVWGDWSPNLPGSPVTAKNLLTNSDFSSGIAGWACYNNNTFHNVIGVSNGEGYLAPDSVYNPSYPYNEYLYQKVNAVVGHKYFLRATVHSNSPANGAEITTQFKDSTDWPADGSKTEEADTTLTKSMYTGNGSYQTLYLDSVAAPANSASLWVTLENTKSNTTNQPEYMDNVVLVDLTATFGAGNEPTADQFNSMFPNYFSNTSTYSGIDFSRAPNVIINKLGTNVIQTEVTDNAGNVNTVNSGNYVLLGEQVNDNPPTMTFSPYSSTWTNQNVSVTMIPHDDVGVYYFIYRVSPDGGSTWGAWSSPIYGGSTYTTILVDTGQYKIETLTVDTTGHTVYSYSGTYQIDKIVPTASYSTNSANYTGSASVLITPADSGGSGVKQLRYRISTDGSFDTESWSSYYSAAPQTITISNTSDTLIQTEVTDNAGNVGTVTSGIYHKITGNISGILEVSDHYYESTDVTGAVVINYTGIGLPDLIPSSGVTVRITAGTSVSTQTILCPANKQSYIPFKFHTPDNSTSSGIPLTIKVEIDPDNKFEETSKTDNIITKTITIDSADYTEPPATTYQPTAPSTWKGTETGSYPSTNTLNWQEWRYENNTLVLKSFYVKAAASFQLTPDSRAASSTYDAASNLWTMRSGYGFSNSTTVHVTTNYDNPDLITLPQRIRVYFPEFDYHQQNNLRELEQTSKTGSATDYTVTYAFKQNPQSRTHARLHFTPLWFQDGDYVVLENARDIWTPGGQLNMWGTYTINISGSVYDDWHAGLIPNN